MATSLSGAREAGGMCPAANDGFAPKEKEEGAVNSMNQSTIFWDTNLFIYLFEENPSFLARVIGLRKEMLARGDILVTSAMTVGEILVKPAIENDRKAGEKYRSFFRSSSVEVIPFGLNAAEYYAAIRADRGISKPDAIQLACAAARGVDLFITNDDRLARKRIPGIRFITGLAGAPI